MSLPPCPACGGATLQRHCSPTNLACPWDHCTNGSCRANVDRVTGQHDHPIVETCAACGPVSRRAKWGERT